MTTRRADQGSTRGGWRAAALVVRSGMRAEVRPGVSVLERAGFFADFLLCPLGIGALVTYALMLGPAPERSEFAVAFIVGAVFWTLAEYLLHRFFLHGVPPLRRAHLLHHCAPQALIGAPAWLRCCQQITFTSLISPDSIAGWVMTNPRSLGSTKHCVT